MGLFDEINFKKSCKICKRKTTWNAQFKWEHNICMGYKIGDKLKSFGNKDMKKFIKNFSSVLEGVAWCLICEENYCKTLGEETRKIRTDSHVEKLQKAQNVAKRRGATVTYYGCDVLIEKGRIIGVKNFRKSFVHPH